MPYTEETYRPKPRTKASRAATAEETRDYLTETLRWMPCAVTVEQLAEKAKEEWAGISFQAVRAALKKLQAEGLVQDESNGAGRLWVTAGRRP
jgi:predicted ArsR family transcriptional regulator